MPTPPAPIASLASRMVIGAAIGGAVSLGGAAFLRSKTDLPDADGTSPGRIDRFEAKELTSGTLAPSTAAMLVPVGAILGVLYTKGRIPLGEATKPAAGLADAVAAAGAKIEKNEAPLTKTLYAFMGGNIIGSVAAAGFVYGDDQYETQRVPAAAD